MMCLCSTYPMTQPTARAPRQTNMRCRSSSRCSTSDASSPWSRRRGSLGLGGRRTIAYLSGSGRGRFVLLRRRRRGGSRLIRDRRRCCRYGRRKLRACLDLLLSADGVLELTHTGAERASDLRQALRAEEEQGEEEQSDDLHGADVWHGRIVAAVSHHE